MEHGHAGGNLHASVGSGSTRGKGSGSHQLGLAVRPDHLVDYEKVKLSVRYFNGYFLVTGPDTEPAKFKTRQQALTWCAAHYPDLRSKKIAPNDWLRPRVRRAASSEPAAARASEAAEGWGRGRWR
jgi:hypothetical protein